MSEPRTEAGRALLDDWMNDEVLNRLPPRGLVSEQLAAIEAEARAQLLREVRERVEALPRWIDYPHDGVAENEDGWLVDRAAVLSLLTELEP